MNEADDGSRPADEHGIRLGWDDEQVATWLNRQRAVPVTRPGVRWNSAPPM
jgi:hypothetical protein